MKETNTSWIISTIRDNKTVHSLKTKLASLLGFRPRPPVITEQSSLREIGLYYSGMWHFLEKKYHLPKSKVDANTSLSLLSAQFDLPPAQILFMEIQLNETSHRVQEITALEASDLLKSKLQLKILDVREEWEREFGSLPKSQPLDKTLLEEISKNWSQEAPILLYCHFGVRSADAAHHLSQLGFSQIYIIKGGIDAWSVQVDPSVPRYSGAYC